MEKLNRRSFLKGAAMTAVGVVAASCAQPTPIIVEKEVPVERVVKETVVVEKQVEVEKVVKETIVIEREVQIEKVVIPSKFKESPQLAAMVAAGDLPPVEDRLPTTPCVYPIPVKAGKYGGALRRGMSGVSDRWGPSKAASVGLCHYDFETLGIWPDICESWETNADASEWTLNLRAGHKWSDGTPLTSGDFVWTHENYYMNDELTPGKGANPTLATTAPDDYTVVIKLQDPWPLWMHMQNRTNGFGPFKPGFYLKQFHADLVEDKAALDKAIKDAGFNTWVELMGYMYRAWNNPEIPDVRPWNFATPINEAVSGLLLHKRNPYFHAVDPDGNQLPYVDELRHRLFETPDVFNMWIVNGEIDWQRRHVQTSNFTLYKENEAKGDYRVFTMVSQSGETLSINHNCKKPLIAEFFQNILVRKALNVAIDRETIVEVAYDGFGVPRQASLTPNSPYYDPEAPKVYAYYDPDEANRLLDEAGYDKKNADGFRLWKDGSDQVFFTIEGTAATGTASSDAVLMVVDYFKKVGVNCTWNQVERSLYEEHQQAQTTEASWWGTGHETLLYLNWGNYYIGEYTDRPWAGGWGRYYRDPSDATAEPPPEGHWLWDMWEIWARGEKALTQEERVQVVKELMVIWKREVPVVGVLGEVPSIGIVKNGVVNVVDGAYASDRTADESIFGAPVLFWEDPENHM